MNLDDIMANITIISIIEHNCFTAPICKGPVTA